MATAYVISLALFALGMLTHSSHYNEAIDPVDGECYSPFSENHILTLIFYFLTFNVSLFLVWKKSRNLPPLTLTLSLIFILTGIVIGGGIIYQISDHNTESISIYANATQEQFFFLCAPIVSIIIGITLLYQVMTQQINATITHTYSNKYLNKLNIFLATRSRNPVWIVLLLFPVLFLTTLILMLFGQDVNATAKVFTDTTTWRLSQQIHPPILDHKGHYLCTVAASGHPGIVKPLRMGKRNGQKIIVNRQLLIANAFEEFIQDISPRCHQLIRKNYDKYGYNISTKINTPRTSSITYILMKPLEWLFLICLYLFCNKPEEKINKQYSA